jgi:ABC-type multidrug transport system fused ATPase/permease subunit
MLLDILSPHRGTAVLAVAIGSAAALAEGIGIGLFIPFFQFLGLEGSEMAAGGWLETRLAAPFDTLAPEQRVRAIALCIFVAVLLKSLFSFANTVLFARLGAQMAHGLREAIHESVLVADIRVLGRMGRGRILNALSEESWRTADAATLLLQGLVAAFTFLLYVTLLLLISWRTTLAVGLLLVVVVGLVRLITLRIGKAGVQLTRTNAKVAGKMVDTVSGVDVIRGYGREDHERKAFASLSERLSSLSVRVNAISGGVYPIYEVIVAAILVSVLVSALQSGMSATPFLVFGLLLYRLVPVVKRLEKTRVDLKALEGAVREAICIAQLKRTNALRSGNQTFDELRDCLVIDHVSYRYEPGAPLALDDVSAVIPAKGLTAIVGPSGSGKSTLVSLLSRFFDPPEGRILVDGVPLPDLRLDNWRSHVALVPQKAFLFNATVRENILYGKLDATDEDVAAAATAAGAHDFIAALPQGYETRLGEEGVELSGGEGQRICLARALIRKPEILLLDEATNALDGLSEKFIHRALEELRQRCAVVVIAHRLATIESADQILVFDAGRLVERGTLTELVKRDGLFSRLYELQRSEFGRELGTQFI